MSTARRPERRIGRGGRIGLLVAAFLLVLVVVDVRYVAFPAEEAAPDHADVLFVLGPHDTGRIAYALRLMDKGIADELVVSTPLLGSLLRPEPSTSFCTEEHPYPVTCFVPDPSTTRGEATQLARWRVERGWDEIVVLTARPHVSRTRYIMDQCAEGPVTVLAYSGGTTPLGWGYQVIYQGIAFVKAAVMGACP